MIWVRRVCGLVAVACLVGWAAGQVGAASPCEARAGGALPDRVCTPGWLNPVVEQGSVGRTICVPGWTATVRPPTSVTSPLKRRSIRDYGFEGRASAYEFDHLVPLELGGATRDVRNLWPEARAGRYGSEVKDGVENALRRAVCSGRIRLSTAQLIMRSNWSRGLRYVPDNKLPPLVP